MPSNTPTGSADSPASGSVSLGTGANADAPPRPKKPQLPSLIRGLGGSIKDFFGNRDKPVRSKTDKPSPRDIQPHYKFDEALDQRILGLADYYYREGSFEKIQFARKWMRNALIFQGYHDLEWSEINVAWDVILQDSGDFAFPNNYYRSLIRHGVRAYVQNEPIIEPTPSSDDPSAQEASKAAKTALDIIKKVVHYDQIRVQEGYNLRLFGNSFRFTYFSKDPRYGYVSTAVYEDADVVLSPGASLCPLCGPLEGSFSQCPGCGQPIHQTMPPVVSRLPQVMGSTSYPKGEIVTEVVNPLEIYLRSSAYDLWHAPFIIRNRVVDRLSLQAAFPDIELVPKGDEGGGEAYSTGGDLGLIYLQSLADLPGDTTQYAAWYERATAAAKALLIEAWLRPSIYFFDKELIRRFPDGVYIAKTGDVLLEARNESLDDHWTHHVFLPVPGRIWGDGDDDLIPIQLKLNETDRLIQRNQGYNSAPLLAIDSQRIDKQDIINDPSTIIEVKSAGRPIKEAYGVIESQPLSAETWNWRNAQLSDLSFHSLVSPASYGQHETGVNTFGGQESAASKSDQSMLPNLMLWKIADEEWARQGLKLASQNWLDERVNAVYGINGRYEFSKLRGSALDLDKFTIETRILPVNPQEQQALSEAVASGLLNPQDPRVSRKALELYHLPTDLDQFYMDSKRQWKEIEMMQKSGQQVQPMLIRDNDQVHIEVCRIWLNSDAADDNPQMTQLVWQHATLHVMNMAKQQQMAAVVAGAGPEASSATAPQQAQSSSTQGQRQPEPPSEEHGGQSPRNPVARRQRAQKGQAAKPNRPQPPSGNQYGRRQLT